MENKTNSNSLFLSISIFLGLSILGFFVFKGFKTFSDKDRVVTVKGLAEMNMTANKALVKIGFSFSGDNLKDIISQAENKKSKILSYLSSNGFDKFDLKIENLDVNDKQKYYEYQWNGNQQVQVKVDRYSVFQHIKFVSKDVTKTEDIIAKIQLDLITNDLTATINSEYTFPDLNSIKPQLIAESTKNARIAGEQFANDSQAQLGKIKTASQGQITIAGRYYYDEEGSEPAEKPKEPYLQKARVVSTIVFFLE